MENPETFNPEEEQHLRYLFEEVEHIFAFAQRREQEVMRHFGNDAHIATGKNARFREATDSQVLSELQIRNSCIKYRLRFLPSSMYHGEVPIEVISSIKRFEHRHPGRAVHFFILAPMAFFLNEDAYRSPLLIARCPDGQFEMVCQWGKKRPWYQEFLRYPFRDLPSLVTASLLTGLAISIIAGLLGFANGPTFFRSMIYKVPLLVLSSSMFSTAALCYGLVTRTDFSADNWNKRYFNR